MRDAYLNVYRHRRRAALRLGLHDSCGRPLSRAALGDYDHEFTLHQFPILPAGATQKFKMLQFDKIKIE